MELDGLEAAVTLATVCRMLGLTWVGIRMLALARRTLAAPELLLGASFLAFNTLGVPLLTLGGYAGARVAHANVPLIAGALALLDVGAVLFVAFVWRVFRPGTASGRLAVAGAALLLLAHLALAAIGLRNASPETAPAAAIGRAELILSAVLSASFVWGTAEALTYWQRLRRQRALGLVDAAAVRRMLLFATGCAAQLLTMAFTGLATLRGTNPLTDPLPAIGMTVTSLATGVAFALAFGFGRTRAVAATA